MTEHHPPRLAVRQLHRVISVMVLAALALGQPILDLLGRNPEFFVARATPVRDVVVTALMIGLVGPLTAGGIVALAGVVGVRLATVVHAALFLVLAALFGSQLALRLGTVGQTGIVRVLGGLVIGAVLLVLFLRVVQLRQAFVFAAVVPVAMVATFLLASPVSRLVLAGTEAQPGEAVQAVQVGRPVPVVIAIFDELPTASLLDGPASIDAERFPAFAAFANDAVWYRNATTVSGATPDSVPAILDGQLPRPGTLPIPADHPDTVYTMLAGTHDLNASEAITKLCPAELCSDVATASAPDGWQALGYDVGVISLHALLPRPWTARLPRIDETLGNFQVLDDTGEIDPAADEDADEGDPDFLLADQAAAAIASDRRLDFTGVTAPGERPPLYVFHTMMPHKPWQYLPSGEAYFHAPAPGIVDDVWGDDATLADNGLRRHLLQAGTADRMLAGLVDDLRTAGIYDDALIVVTADHGISLAPGTDWRAPAPDTVATIASVPLLVRYPDGPSGVVDRRDAVSVDVLPTIIDALDITGAPDMAGRSLLTEPAPMDGATRTIRHHGAELDFDPADADPWPVAEGIRDRFGSGWSDLYRLGELGDLVGTDVDDLEVGDDADVGFRIPHRSVYADLDRSSGLLPDLVDGEIEGAIDARSGIVIAIDGRIAGVGEAFAVTENGARFQTMLDPDLLADGANEVTIFVVEDATDQDGRNRVLRPLRDLEIDGPVDEPSPSPAPSPTRG